MNRMQEEIESVKAIFCKKGEFAEEEDVEGHSITVNFHQLQVRDVDSLDQPASKHSANVRFLLSSKYPDEKPLKIGLNCSCLPRDKTFLVQQQLERRALDLEGEAMILDLCCLAQDLLQAELEELATKCQTKSKDKPCGRELPANTSNVSFDETTRKLGEEDGETAAETQSQSHLDQFKVTNRNTVPKNYVRSEQNPSGVTALLHLDHMRSQQHYVKLIKKWTSQLGLVGRLIFCQKLILILLQGKAEDIKEYIVRNRTTNVDVDSKGRSCKERMLTVLCEVETQIGYRLADFSVVDVSSHAELEKLFEDLEQEAVYKQFVSSLLIGQGARFVPSKK